MRQFNIFAKIIREFSVLKISMCFDLVQDAIQAALYTALKTLVQKEQKGLFWVPKDQIATPLLFFNVRHFNLFLSAHIICRQEYYTNSPHIIIICLSIEFV